MPFPHSPRLVQLERPCGAAPHETESRLLNACAGAAIPALRIAVVAGFCVGALAITANRCCLAILGAAVAVICVAVVALFTGERVEETITAEGERAVGIAACTLQAPSITLLAAIQNTISAQIDDAFAAIFIFLIAVAKIPQSRSAPRTIPARS